MRRLPDAVYRLVGIAGRSRVVTRLHPVLYRAFRGRGPLGRSMGLDTVILTTVGRRSGKRRDAPLYALRDGDGWLLVGTHGGEEKLPDWVANLRADPDAEILDRGRRTLVRAREPEGAEYDRLWTRAVAAYPGYAVYRSRRTTDPPLVVLEPRAG